MLLQWLRSAPNFLRRRTSGLSISPSVVEHGVAELATKGEDAVVVVHHGGQAVDAGIGGGCGTLLMVEGGKGCGVMVQVVVRRNGGVRSFV